jgi:SSS family solute:Na+ symporter
MVGGFPVVWLVSLLTPKMNRNLVNSIFECYK